MKTYGSVVFSLMLWFRYMCFVFEASEMKVLQLGITVEPKVPKWWKVAEMIISQSL